MKKSLALVFSKKKNHVISFYSSYIVPELYIGVAACFKSLLFLHDFVNSWGVVTAILGPL